MLDTSFLVKDQNPEVKPGDDFFEFAVGNWMKNNPIPDDYSRWGSFEMLIEDNYQKIKYLLENIEKEKSDKDLTRKISAFYRSGNSETDLERGMEVLNKYFELVNRTESKEKLMELIPIFHKSGFFPFFGMFVEPDAQNSEKEIAYLQQGGLGLHERNYYLNDDETTKKIRSEYLNLIKNLFALTGEANGRVAEDVIKMETEIAKFSRTKEELRDPKANYNKRTMSELKKAAPFLEWGTYLEREEDVNLRQPEFFSGIHQLINTYSLESLKKYFIWNVINGSASFLPQKFAEEKFKFYGIVLQGQKKMKDRHKRVIDAMERLVGQAVGIFYVEKYFPLTAKKRAEELVQNLLVAMEERIKGLSWMGEETKREAIKKLWNIKIKIGFPDEWIDHSNWKTGESYLENFILAHQFEWDRQLKKIGQPTDRNEWYMPPQMVNAYYDQTKNEIAFPAGILQPPFFYAEGDDALNYGGIGTVIGHEITHGFDDKGRQYDHAGNLKDWWKKEDEEKFKTLADKLVSQFDSYAPLPDVKLNGTFTLGENIADLGGLMVAMTAFKKIMNDEEIDGFTPIQRFFLNYAQTEKNNSREERIRFMIMVDPHSPGKYRVNGPLFNMDDFYEAFSIQNGALFKRPAERIVIW